MAERWEAVEVERTLSAMASSVEFPSLPDLSGVVGARIREGSRPSSLRLARPRPPVFRPAWHRWVAVVAVMVAAFTATMAVSPGARHAVAHWLGLRGVEIRTTPGPLPTSVPTAVPAGLGSSLELGLRVTLEQAQRDARFGVVLPHDAALGEPDEVWFGGRFAGGQVSLVYRTRPGLPVASTTGVAVLVTEFEAGVEETLLLKEIPAGDGTTVEPVTVNGGQGFWISGAPHAVMYFRQNGTPVPDTVRLAKNVLVWEQGSVTVRIESALSKERALALAATVR